MSVELNIVENVENVTITITEVQGPIGPVGPAGSTTFAALTDAPEDNLLLAAALDAKQDALTGTNDVPGLTAALAAKANDADLDTHTSNTSNPHSVTAAQAGAVPTTRTVSTTAPLAGGGALSGNLTLSIAQATALVDGYLAAADFVTFANHAANTSNPHSVTAAQVGAYTTGQTDTLLSAKAPTSRLINTTSPITGGGDLSADRTIAMPVATGSADGYLASVDWTTFNSKQTGNSKLTAFAALADAGGILASDGAGNYSWSSAYATSAAVAAGYQPLAANLTELAALADGTDGQVLTLTAGAYDWADAAGGASELYSGGASLPYANLATVQSALGIVPISGLTTNNVPKWNGTTFVDSAISNAVASVVAFNGAYLSLGNGATPNTTDYGIGVDAGTTRLQTPTAGHIRQYCGSYNMFSLNVYGAILSQSGSATTPVSGQLLTLRSTTEQLRLEYSSGVDVRHTVDASGNYKVFHSGSRLAIGSFALTVSGDYSQAIGYNPAAIGQSSVAIGHSPSATGTGTVAIGYGATTGNNYSIAHGFLSAAAGTGATALGYHSSAPNNYSLAAGYNPAATGVSSVAIGHSPTASANYSMAFGYDAEASVANTAVFGSQSQPISTIWAGGGMEATIPTHWGIRGTGGSGTNINGGDIAVDAGAGTGAGATGLGHLRATTVLTTGTTLQSTWNNKLSWNSVGIGLNGATPVAQSAAIADATDAGSVITQLNTLLAYLRTRGDIAT